MLTDDPRQVAHLLTGFVEEIIQRVGTEVVRELFRQTPVDTGYARSNWIASVGQPVAETFGSKKAIDVGRQQQGLEDILTYKLTHGSLFICNNVIYINRLDNGWSTQAPVGFVHASIYTGIQQALGALA